MRRGMGPRAYIYKRVASRLFLTVCYLTINAQILPVYSKYEISDYLLLGRYFGLSLGPCPSGEGDPSRYSTCKYTSIAINN